MIKSLHVLVLLLTTVVLVVDMMGEDKGKRKRSHQGPQLYYQQDQHPQKHKYADRPGSAGSQTSTPDELKVSLNTSSAPKDIYGRSLAHLQPGDFGYVPTRRLPKARDQVWTFNDRTHQKPTKPTNGKLAGAPPSSGKRDKQVSLITQQIEQQILDAEQRRWAEQKNGQNMLEAMKYDPNALNEDPFASDDEE